MRAARITIVIFVLGCQSVGLAEDQGHRTDSSACSVLEGGHAFSLKFGVKWSGPGTYDGEAAPEQLGRTAAIGQAMEGWFRPRC